MLLTGCDKKAPEPAAPTQTVDAKRPDTATIAENLAARDYEAAAKNAKAAIASEQHNPELYLLLARAEARLQNVEEAIEALQKSFDEGFHDPRGALNNPDFDGIHSNSAFLELALRYADNERAPQKRKPGAATGTIRAGDVSITEGKGGHSRIRAGDVEIGD